MYFPIIDDIQMRMITNLSGTRKDSSQPTMVTLIECLNKVTMRITLCSLFLFFMNIEGEREPKSDRLQSQSWLHIPDQHQQDPSGRGDQPGEHPRSPGQVQGRRSGSQGHVKTVRDL